MDILGETPHAGPILGMGAPPGLWSDAGPFQPAGRPHASHRCPAFASVRALREIARAAAAPARCRRRRCGGRSAGVRQGAGGGGRLRCRVLRHQRGAAVAAGPDQLLAVRAAVGPVQDSMVPNDHLF